MKKRLIILAVALAMLALPALAQAETPHGFYLGLQGGVNYKMDRDYTWINLNPPFGFPDIDFSTDFNWGWGAGATLGYAFAGTRNWFAKPRIELELTWRRNTVNTFTDQLGTFDRAFIYDGTFKPADIFGGGVRFTSMATMANLLFDFDLGGKVYPYVGFGFGAATGWFTWDDAEDNSFGKLQDTAFAYQGKVGLGFIINPNVSLFAEYTYIGSTDFVQDNRELTGMSDHSIMAGVRFYFSKPQSVPKTVEPVVIPTPAEPQLLNSFRVFFDHDSSVVDNAAKSVIAQAVAEFNSKGALRIDVTGHTDTTGSVAYNLALSERRAEAVTNALVNAGIPRSAISVFAAGQYDLLVPTADNVRERQNRNVYMYIYK